ncbi:diaminopropionate ammonia-lyase [Desulfovibrio sp. OttesenSCG-928-G11]|nr:diaminopropionate ammonia-lyase [Desulfovibrio sp. OttesenSCG-928-G11]
MTRNALPPVRLILNSMRKSPGQGPKRAAFAPEAAARVRAFHAALPGYAPTPLTLLPRLAESLALGQIMVKDESKRAGLNAFKVLGSSWAVGRHLAEQLGLIDQAVTPGHPALAARPDLLEKTVLITATDGNHGRGLARTAALFGCRCIVLMPSGSEQSRVDNIRAEGAECRVTDRNYDATVQMARELAVRNGYLAVQDTDWEGYRDIPDLIMQGYNTLVLEAMEQMAEAGVSPTHCIVQAGVGSFAGAVAACLAEAMGDQAPLLLVAEPHSADCHYRSAQIADGKSHASLGDLRGIMAGLSCGVPCTLSWEILRDTSHAFISCADHIAANGMRILAAPLPGDPPLLSGESGAVGAGLLEYLMRPSDPGEMRKELKLGPDSRVLLISTEGDTAPDVYKEVVWRGRCPDPDLG